ncbi:hypothetical protein [Specibacter sp. RAF43]|uniref:hypothetical protein n=1 Tax=Specibacter sp. RAF43 TaxID=3233057 RepID=UPI003F96865C
MTVPAKAFQHWLAQVAGGRSTAEVCRVAGIKRSTLAQQLVRGRVSVATVAAVSRSLELPVVNSLSAFAKYQDLATGMKPPTDAELLSQIFYTDLLREILRRSASCDSGTSSAAIKLSALPHRGSVRTWLDAVGPADLRARVARIAGIAPQNLSAQISADRLAPDLAILSARIAGVGLANGLVASGFLRPAEAGWAPDAREKILRETSNSALVSLAAARLDSVSRTLKRAEQDAAAAQTVWENLG